MAVDDVVGLHVVGRYQSQNIVNNLSYQIDAQASAETTILQELCAQWDDTVTAAWVARHIDTYELIGLKAFNLVGVAKLPGFLALGTAGTVVGTEVPAPLCRVITLYTASEKYRRRGQVQLSGGDVAMFDDGDGSVTDAEKVALEAIGDILREQLTAGGDTFTPCIPANATDPVEQIIDARPRKTPALIRSRRIRQFLIG